MAIWLRSDSAPLHAATSAVQAGVPSSSGSTITSVSLVESGTSMLSRGNGTTGMLAPRRNPSSTSLRIVGLVSVSSSGDARRSLTTFFVVGWWPILNPSEPTLRMNLGLALQGKRGVVHGRSVHLRRTEGEAQLRQVRELVRPAAGRSEEDRRPDAAVDVSQRAPCVGVQRLGAGMFAGVVRIDGSDES